MNSINLKKLICNFFENEDYDFQDVKFEERKYTPAEIFSLCCKFNNIEEMIKFLKI